MATKKSGGKGTRGGRKTRARAAGAADEARPEAAAPGGDFGDYITLNGKRVPVRKHPTDFSVMVPPGVLAGAVTESFGARRAGTRSLTEAVAEAAASTRAGAESADAEVKASPLTEEIVRVTAPDDASRDRLMDGLRQETVAHHIYQKESTGEEYVINNLILLTLRHENTGALEEIIEEFKLVPEGRMGNAYKLRVTEATGRNPLKVANEIAQREEVASCQPDVLLEMGARQAPFADTHRLFRRQWYLSSELLTHADLHPDAGVRAPEAWQITTGSPEVVIAVIDDGFDLDHPAFRNKRIHPARRDFGVLPQDDDPRSEGNDFHGTCVASIATGSRDGDGMVGIAPNCTLLPIRITFGPLASQVDILEVFRYASAHADVVNCSFGTSPWSEDLMHPEFRNAITELARSGGRRGKGLVFVFSAGNDDSPTFLRRAQNRQGVRFVRFAFSGPVISTIPPDNDIFSGYPMTRGVIVVGAMSSLKRKSGYSNWGPHLTVTAPSNNMHYITRFIDRGADPARDLFVANYRGLGQVAAANRPGRGRPFEPLPDDPGTPGFQEQFYTASFGGTSGAAPVVTGIVALMLSVNPNLTADQVRQILTATADQDLDPSLDLRADPNVQGLSGSFDNGRSLFFGAGKVNALRAVERARALLGPAFTFDGAAASPYSVHPGLPPGAPLTHLGNVRTTGGAAFAETAAAPHPSAASFAAAEDAPRDLEGKLKLALKNQIMSDVPGAQLEGVPFATTPLGFYYGRDEKAKTGVYVAANKFIAAAINMTLNGTEAGKILFASVSLSTTLNGAVTLMRQAVLSPLNPL
jgi:subtilisin family serine protease